MALMTDNTLYDAVIAEIPPSADRADDWTRGYEIGYDYAAQVASRIAAERTTPMPSDEELFHILRKAERDHLLADDPRRGYYSRDDMMAGIRAVREAITAAQPMMVPDGWEMRGVIPDGDGFLAKLRKWDDAECRWTFIALTGSTWQEALQAAIAATGEEE